MPGPDNMLVVDSRENEVYREDPDTKKTAKFAPTSSLGGIEERRSVSYKLASYTVALM